MISLTSMNWFMWLFVQKQVFETVDMTSDVYLHTAQYLYRDRSSSHHSAPEQLHVHPVSSTIVQPGESSFMPSCAPLFLSLLLCYIYLWLIHCSEYIVTFLLVVLQCLMISYQSAAHDAFKVIRKCPLVRPIERNVAGGQCMSLFSVWSKTNVASFITKLDN